MYEKLDIREVLVCVEKRTGISMRRHSTLEDLARSLLYRWPDDCRGEEWVHAQLMCLDAMEGVRDPDQARGAFIAAANAAEMLMVREEYLVERPEPRPKKPARKSRQQHSPTV